MDISTVVLYFYLLFPIISPYQKLINDFSDKKLSAQEEFKIRQDLISYFNRDEEIFSENGLLQDDLESESQSFYILKTIDDELRYFKNDETSLTVSNYSNNGKKEKFITSVNSDKFWTLKYNDDYQLIEKIVWKNSTDYSQIKLESKIIYEYSDFIIQNETNYLTNKNIITSLNQKNLPVKKEIYKFSDEKSDSKLESEFFYHYDSKDRITKKEEIKYSDEDNSTYNLKYVFSYTNKSDTPNSYFYEDEVLRMKTVYTAEYDYEEIKYFDSNITIKTFYENGKKIKEELLTGGNKNEK